MSAAPGVVVWFTGLPAAGKSTLARRVRERLARARPCVLLDSDELRAVLGASGYDEESRAALYRSLRALAALLAAQGLVVLVAATAPRREHRAFEDAALRLLEVYVRTPLEVCEARDPKGLYGAARSGASSTLPGVGSAYEPPEDPAVIADGGDDERAIAEIVELASA